MTRGGLRPRGSASVSSALVLLLLASGALWTNVMLPMQDTAPLDASTGVIQSFGSTNGTGSATLSASPSAATAAGDLLVATVKDRNTTVLAPVTGVTDSAGNHWVRAASVTRGGHADGEIWYVANAASLATSQVVTVTVGGTSASTTAIALTVLEVAGASPSPLDVTATRSGGSQPASTGTTAATAQAAEVAIADIGWSGIVTSSSQTVGYITTAVEQSTIKGSADGEQAAWQLLTVAGQQSYSARLSSSKVAWTGAIATFKVGGPPAGLITGTVTDSITSAGISAAMVSYSDGSTTTDPSGAYTLGDVAPGTYTVTASAIGYSTQSVQVSVNSGATTTQGFALIPLGAVNGTVTDSGTNARIPGATVTYSNGGSATTTPHVMVIMEENKGYAATLGSCSADPYLCGLASSYASVTPWYGVSHPSVPNYLAIDSGSTQGQTSDCTSCGPFTATDLGGQLTAAGIPWAAYMESMPSACYTGTGGLPATPYTKRHNPFVYFTDVLDNGCAQHVLPYPGVSSMISALDGAGAPSFVWISPNLYDDMHSSTVTAGDSWLQANLGPVLASPWFTGANATVIVTMDEHEDDDTGCCGDAAGGLIPTVVISSAAGGKGSVATVGDLYGTLRTIEETYGLGFLGAAAGAADGDLLQLFSYTGSTTTDSNGGYTLSNVEPGTYTITCSAPGYTPQSMQISVTAGATTMQDFSLAPVTAGSRGRSP